MISREDMMDIVDSMKADILNEVFSLKKEFRTIVTNQSTISRQVQKLKEAIGSNEHDESSISSSNDSKISFDINKMSPDQIKSKLKAVLNKSLNKNSVQSSVKISDHSMN
jgi:hypothetical protein